MKNLFLAVLFLVSIASYGQDVLDPIEKTVTHYTDAVSEMPDLEEISSIEKTVVHYTKEVMETSKIALTEAINFILEEGTIVVKQYLMYQAISYGIPVLVGLLLIFVLSRRLMSYFTVDTAEAVAYNEEIDSDTSQDFKKKAKHIKFMKKYYTNRLSIVGGHIAFLTPAIIGSVLVVNNFLSFVKVTFFPKLYLVETIAQYL